MNTLLAVVLIAWMAQAAAQEQAMSPAQFAAELERLSDAVSSGAPGAVPSVRVPAVWAIEADGQRFEMPAIWLRTALSEAARNPDTWPSQRATILAQLQALRDETEGLTTSSSTAAPNPDAARAALTQVLAGPEFERMAQESAFARLRQRVTQWLIQAWERLGGARLGSRNTAILFAWMAVLVAVTALTIWLARFLRQPQRSRLALTAPHAARTPAGVWARQARQAADPREAIRCAYRAIISGLEEEGAWRSDDSRTPREYRRILAPDHRRHPLVADVTRRFEEIWFGARRATDDDRAAALTRLKEMGWLRAE